jgi:hypothetical protein
VFRINFVDSPFSIGSNSMIASLPTDGGIGSVCPLAKLTCA